MSMRPSNARKRRAARSAETSSSASDDTDKSDAEGRSVEASLRSSLSTSRTRPLNIGAQHRDVEFDSDDYGSTARKVSDRSTKTRQSQSTAQISRFISGNADRNKQATSNAVPPREASRKLARTSLSRDVGTAGQADRNTARKTGMSNTSRAVSASHKSVQHRSNDRDEDSDMVFVAPTVSKATNSNRDSISKVNSRSSTTVGRSTSGIARPLFRSDDEADTTSISKSASRSRDTSGVRKYTNQVITVDMPDSASPSDDGVAFGPSKTALNRNVSRSALSSKRIIEHTARSFRINDRSVPPADFPASRKGSAVKRKEPKMSDGKRGERIVNGPKGASQSSRNLKRARRSRAVDTTSTTKPTTRPLLQPESRSPAVDSYKDSDVGMDSDGSIVTSVPVLTAPRQASSSSRILKPPLSRPSELFTSYFRGTPAPTSKRTIGSASVSDDISDKLQDLLPLAGKSRRAASTLPPDQVAPVNEEIKVIARSGMPGQNVSTLMHITPARKVHDVPLTSMIDLQDQQHEPLRRGQLHHTQLAEETTHIARYRESLEVEKFLLSKAREELVKSQQEFSHLREEFAATQEKLNASYDEIRRESRDQQRRYSQLLEREQAAAADRDDAQRLLDKQQANLQAERDRFRREVQREHEALAKLRAEIEDQRESQLNGNSRQDRGIALNQPAAASVAVQTFNQPSSRVARVTSSSERGIEVANNLNCVGHGHPTDRKQFVPKKRKQASAKSRSSWSTSASRSRLRASDGEESDGPFVISRHPEPTTSEDEERTRREEEADRLDFEEATRLYDTEIASQQIVVPAGSPPSHTIQQPRFQYDEQPHIRISGRNSLTHPDDVSEVNGDRNSGIPAMQGKQQIVSMLSRASRSSQKFGSSSTKDLIRGASPDLSAVRLHVTPLADACNIADKRTSDEAAFPALADESEQSDHEMTGSRSSRIQEQLQTSLQAEPKPQAARKTPTVLRHVRAVEGTSPLLTMVEQRTPNTGPDEGDEPVAVASDNDAAASPEQKTGTCTTGAVELEHTLEQSVDRPATLAARPIESTGAHEPDIDIIKDRSDDNTAYLANDVDDQPNRREDIQVPDMLEIECEAIDEVSSARTGESNEASVSKRHTARPRKDAIRLGNSSKPSSRSSRRTRPLSSENLSTTVQERQSLSPSIDDVRAHSKSGSPEKQLKPSVHAGRRRESKFQPQKKPRQSLRDIASDSSAEDEVVVAGSSTIGQPPPRASQAQIDFRQAEARRLAERMHGRVDVNRKSYGRFHSGGESPEGDHPAQSFKQGQVETSAPSGPRRALAHEVTPEHEEDQSLADENVAPAPGIVHRQWSRGSATLAVKRSAEGGEITRSSANGQVELSYEAHRNVDAHPDAGELEALSPINVDETSEAAIALDDIVDASKQRFDTDTAGQEPGIRDCLEDALADLHETIPLAAPEQELLMQVADEVIASDSAARKNTAIDTATSAEPEVANTSEPDLQTNGLDSACGVPVQSIEVVETVTAAVADQVKPQPFAEDPCVKIPEATKTVRAVSPPPPLRSARLGSHIVDLGSTASGPLVNGTAETDHQATVSLNMNEIGCEEANNSHAEADDATEALRGVHEQSIELEEAVQAAQHVEIADQTARHEVRPERQGSDSYEGPHDVGAEENDDTTDAPGGLMSEAEDSNDAFDRRRLLAWANELTDRNDRSVIGEDGVVRLFEKELSLGLTGLPPLLLAWRLDATDRGRFDKHDYVQLLEDNELDTPAKLSVWLEKLQTNTLAIRRHKRFLSAAASDGTQQQTITFRVPTQYKEFYRFCFGALREPDSDHMPILTALKLWEVIMKPFFETGMDILKFIEIYHDADSKISRTVWNALLDFCQHVSITAEAGAPLSGHEQEERQWPGVIGKYVEWVAEGRPDIASELSEAESMAMET